MCVRDNVNEKDNKRVNVYKYVRISKRVSFVSRIGPLGVKLNILTRLKHTQMLTQPSDVITVLTAALVM